MSDNELADFWVDQSLEIFIPTKGAFFTQIVNNDDDLHIQRPVNNKNVPLIVEDGMSVTVYFHNGMEGLYSFESKLHQLNKHKFSIKRPTDDKVEKAQRRRFFRVQVALNMNLLIASLEEKNKVEKSTVMTYDISGGGVAFLTHTKIVEKDNIIKGIIHLAEDKQIEFTGKIVHVIQQPNKIYRNSIEFMDMSEAVRSEIVQFCMFKQIELRNKIKGNT